MKKTLSVICLVVVTLQLHAKIFVAVEGGMGEVGLKKQGRDFIVPYLGIQGGVSYKLLVAGVGIRNWRTDFGEEMKTAAGTHQYMRFVNSFVKNTSIPFFVGINLPLDERLCLQGRGVFAPTFIRGNNVTAYGISDYSATITRKEYNAAGFEIAAEYKFNRHTAAMLKFVHLEYLENLQYRAANIDAAIFYNSLASKPIFNGAAFQFNYYF
ncbi:MAG: hypothetical protein EOP51_11655 [Sphingobacteriales bacterium]|nr:MAG: hypothetical protein EOP51_11655 [Sphingobacteriales bacterium]